MEIGSGTRRGGEGEATGEGAPVAPAAAVCVHVSDGRKRIAAPCPHVFLVPIHSRPLMDETSSQDVSDDSEIRCEEFLRVKIGEPFPLLSADSPDETTDEPTGEAKNLTPRNGSARDVFCTVNLDREEIFRTSVAEKTLW